MRWRRLGILAGIALFLGIAYLSTDLADYVPPFPVDFEEFSAKMSWLSDRTDTIIEIVGLLLLVLIPLIGYIYKRNRELKSYFEVMWKKSSSLSPEEVLGLRGLPKHGFLDYYYYERDNDKIIRDRISSNKNVLVLGNPLAGKSRAVYQALRSSDRDVLIPRVVDVNPESFQIPFHLKFWRRRVVFFDDIDKFTDVQNFNYLIQAILKKKDITIIATCRCGPEYAKLSGKMESQLSFIFEDPVEIAKISVEEADEIPKTIGTEIPSEFDGNIGSIFLKLDTMRERFRGCDGIETGMLWSIKRLYYAGIYDEREVFSIERIKRVCEKVEEIDLKNYKWRTAINNLRDLGFIELPEGEKCLQAEEAYLKYVITNSFNYIENLKSMNSVFSEDPDSLYKIGNRAYNDGIVDLQKKNYLWVAIEAYQDALEARTLDRFSIQYASIQNNLGVAHRQLAEIEDTAENCKRAIKAFQEALQIRTIYRFPLDYAATQNNLGNAYRLLAVAEDTTENCKRAIKAFQEALKIRILERVPIDYAMTQNNLGTAYSTLAEVEDTAENCKRAIEAYREALKVRTLDQLPIDYAATQNNLGNTYRLLAEVEDTAENCNNSIKAHHEALKVRTRDRFPMDYAMSQHNLGSAYHTFSWGRDTAESCKKAIKAYQEALKVRTLSQFPIDYAATQNNLGNAYSTLANVEDTAENCKRAIKAYQEALKVRTFSQFPIDYAMTQNNLGIAFSTLAEVEDTAENCKRAIKAYQEALKIRILDRVPIQYASTQNNLGAAYRTLAEVEGTAENCKRAIEAYTEALKVSTFDRFPTDYAMTQNNLGIAFSTLAEVEDTAENCKRAIEAYREALKVFTKEEFPEFHPRVEKNLKILLDFCKG